MDDKTKNESPDISGVPKEIRKNIVADLEEANSSMQPPQAKIGISISENEDLASLGYSNIHLRDLTIEIARHVLINNFVLVYGGDLRREGFTEMFSDLAYQYRSIGSYKGFYFENFFSYPIYCQITRQNELEFKRNRTKVIKVSPPKDLEVSSEQYLLPSTLENKFVWARSLSHMRNQMIAETGARLLIGGKCDNYLGKLPGIIEEAKITISQNKPLYLVGAFGGASKQITDVLKGKTFSFANSSFHQSQEYKSFKDFYNSKMQDEQIEIKSLEQFFKDYSVKNISDRNGLTIDENLRLFDTPHLSEIMSLIFTGLTRILR